MTDGDFCAAVELRAMTAAWHGLAAGWELTAGERRELFPAGGDDRDDPPDDTRCRMRLLVEIGHRVRFDDGAELTEWLRRPTLMFALATPLEVMSGSMGELLRFRSLVERGFGS